jgi:protein subunit release factor A
MKYKKTKNEIYHIVNSIKPTSFTEAHREIRFEFIEDSRFNGKTLDEMIKEFKEKAQAEGLRYELGVRHEYFFEKEKVTQHRIGCKIFRELLI